MATRLTVSGTYQVPVSVNRNKRRPIPIFLNHTIVPTHDHEAAARFFAKIFGLSYDGPAGHFATVVVNDTLTLDFDNQEEFESHHYAFHVGDEDFDAIFGRVKAEGIPYGSGPRETVDMQINTRRGGLGFYFLDHDGHNIELLTRLNCLAVPLDLDISLDAGRVEHGAKKSPSIAIYTKGDSGGI